jgi:outer membrane protein OmpA-like peptidoglycan-associated protein
LEDLGLIIGNDLTKNIFLLFLLLSINIHTQCFSTPVPEDTLELKPRYGIFGSYGLNIHQTGFGHLNGVESCCNDFEGGRGKGFSAGLLYDYPIEMNFFLNFRLMASYLGADLSRTEETNIIIAGESAPGQFEHTLEVDSYIAAITISGGYRLFDHLFTHLGFLAGYQYYTHYSQQEEIIKPEKQGTFINGKRIRNESTGTIPDARSIQLGIPLGLSYELPLNRNRSLLASPEFYYTYHFTPIQSDLDWQIHSFRAGISIKYKEPPAPPPPPPPPAAPPYPELPIPSVPPLLTAYITAVKIDTNGVETADFNISIEDFVSLNVRPLLSYVFFDEGLADIPSRYKRLSPDETNIFNIDSLKGLNAIETYYHILNIIGQKLREIPLSKIFLIGTNAGKGIEKNNLQLSAARAEAVSAYLKDVWGINGERIIINQRNLPEQYSESDEPGADDENRRVEIVAEGFDLTEPIITTDTLRIVDKSRIRFVPRISSSAGIRSWELRAYNEKQLLYRESGEGKTIPNLIWEPGQNKNLSDGEGTDIYYQLSLVDSLNQSVSVQGKPIVIEKLTIDRKRLEGIEDKEFEYYSLILFDYGKSKLEKSHRKLINFVKGRLTDNASVVIFGYTDRIGKEDINKRISESRAREVAKLLDIENADVAGIGESELLYDNDLPEGRFYCRTVRIEIITPLKEE